MRSMVIAFALAACGSGPSASAVARLGQAPTFLETAATAVPTPFDGRVLQVVPAGGYTYLEVDAGDVPRWVVILRKDVSVGDALSVRPFGQLDDFTSKKTGRTFRSLVFATVTPRSV